MIYTYCAQTRDGILISSKGHFSSVRDLLELLHSQELTLVSYRKKRFSLYDTLMTSLSPRIQRLEIAEFCESLASMIGSGLPLLDSMESIKETIKVKRLKTSLEEVIRQVSRGESLSGAFAAQPTVFPDMLVFFCSIGEETGTITDALKNTAQHLQKVDTIVSQVKRALIYPAFVISAMLCVMLFWLFFVLPRLVATFHDIDVQLPDITVSLVQFVELSRQYWYVFVFILVLCTFLMMLLRRFERTRLLLARICFKIPVVGELLKYSSLTIFFSNMSLMLHAGVTLTKSLDVLASILKNPMIKNIILQIMNATNRGDSLLEAFRGTQFFDAITLKMISVGEKTGTLDQRLDYLALTYQERTSRFVEVMGKMIEPVVMVISGGLFIFIIISLIGPVYDLISQLGGG
ncbi:MAG: type II secretion system F family protein [Desulfomonilia bacterium]